MLKEEPSMKRILLIALMFTFLIGCEREDKKMDAGIITGTDPRDCMCCGGWFVEIKDTVRRFDQVPADCLIDFTTVTYPLKVRLEWKKKELLCLGDEIFVISMEKEK
jgi:hypothetical protein